MDCSSSWPLEPAGSVAGINEKLDRHDEKWDRHDGKRGRQKEAR
jgi:hypothetical protein